MLVLTYLLLLRAFRSLLLPLKAVLLNLLSVAAAYGAARRRLQVGRRQRRVGLYQFAQVEGWIPIFLFAMLFGLSMDYEVFLVSRMREAWDEAHDNTRAVAHRARAHRADRHRGRDHDGRRVLRVRRRARSLGLQEFGFGLAVAIFIDATIVRALLVPALMALFGRWNWWLPERMARVVRVRPSPLEPARKPALRPAGR